MQPDQPTPADPIAPEASAPASRPPAPETPDASSADVDTLTRLVQEQGAAIAQLRADLANRPPAAGPVPVTGTAPAGAATPAAVAGAGAPAHVMLADGADVSAGDVLRFSVESATGGDPLAGYGLVIATVDVDDDTGGQPRDGKPSHTEYVIARLDVLGVRLRAGDIVDDEASAQRQAQLDAAASG